MIPIYSSSIYFRLGVSGQMFQNIALGGMMIALPIYFQMVFEYTAMQTGLAIAPMSLSIFIIALLAGRRAGKRSPSRIIRTGFRLVVPRGFISDPFNSPGRFGLEFFDTPGDYRIGIGLVGFSAK